MPLEAKLHNEQKDAANSSQHHNMAVSKLEDGRAKNRQQPFAIGGRFPPGLGAQALRMALTRNAADHPFVQHRHCRFELRLLSWTSISGLIGHAHGSLELRTWPHELFPNTESKPLSTSDRHSPLRRTYPGNMMEETRQEQKL